MSASARVRATQERRRSNAAGTHDARPTRAVALAAVLADELGDLCPGCSRLAGRPVTAEQCLAALERVGR